MDKVQDCMPGKTIWPDYTYAFQPIVDVERQQVFSYEALIRGQNGESAYSVFSRIDDNDLLLFDQQSKNNALVLAAKLDIDCLINLNFLPRSIQQADQSLPATLEFLAEHGLRTSQIVVEITENEAVVHREDFAACVNRHRSLGFQIAIDDFGAGHSGLNMLANSQPDMVKLDMHLIRGIHAHGPRQAIVQVCFDLGIDLIAEGVETLDEYRWLKAHRIHLYQGYLFAKPGFECLPPVVYPD